MPINDVLSNTADASDENAQNMGMSLAYPNLNDLHDGPISGNVQNPLQTAGGRRVKIARPYTILAAPSSITGQSTPHRAWEVGYQSPFAQTIDHPLEHGNTRPGHSSYGTDSLSYTPRETRDDYSYFPTANTPTRPRAAPTPLSNLSASPLVRDTTTLQHSESMSQRSASYRPRIRKVVTKEITLNDIDISAMVSLGMSPFMVGQDTIANQNRFVRNECVFARQFLRLQRATAHADTNHSRTERDIYQHLEQHKASLDKLASGSGSGSMTLASVTHSARTDPDFLALEMAHQETCARLEALSRQLMEYSQSTQRALMDLAQRINQMNYPGAYSAHPDDIPQTRAIPNPLSPLISSPNTSNFKRKWDSSADSILESPRTMPPPTPNFRNEYLSRAQ